MKQLNKILAYLAISSLYIWKTFAETEGSEIDYSNAIKSNILPTNVKTVIQWEELKVDWTTSYLDLIISGFLDGQLFFWMIVAITVFMILWWKLLIANWNDEEHSSAMKWLIYAGVWIALIPLWWVIIRLITSISFN